MQQHQREQPVGLGIVRRPRQLAGQPDRLRREVDVARVALVEHEVQHPHHRARRRRGRSTPACPTVRLARLMRCAIVLSGTRYAWAIWRVVSPPTARSVRRDRRRRREVGVRAQEVEVERVVEARHLAGRRRGVVPHLAIATGRIRPGQVEERPPRDRDQPALGVGGLARRPTRRAPGRGLLHRVLGRREVCTATDEDAQDLRDELTELDVVHRSVGDGRAARSGRDGPRATRGWARRWRRGGRQLAGELDRPLVACRRRSSSSRR